MWTDGHTDTKKLIIVFRNFANATKKMYPVCFLARQPPTPPFPAGQVHLILEVSRSHTTTHHSRYDSSGRVISSSQRPLHDNTQHSQETNIHAAGGFRTHNRRGESPKTYVLDGTATGTSSSLITVEKFNPEDSGKRFLRNSCTYLPIYRMSYPRILQSNTLATWGPR